MQTVTLTPPAGEWHAVSLEEAPAPDGPFTTVQAAAVDSGDVTLHFRPGIEGGYYRPVWVGDGKLVIGEIVLRPELPTTPRGAAVANAMGPPQSRAVFGS